MHTHDLPVASERHPLPAARPPESMICAGAGTRLGLAGACLAVLWLAVLWALQ